MSKGEITMQKLATGVAYQFTPADGYTPDMGRRPTVLIVHGWKSTHFTSATYFNLALKLQAIGYHTMQLSLRGHQGSDGDIAIVTRREHLDDIQCALDYLYQRPEVAWEQVCAFGTSYGAYLLACQPASFKLLAFRAPALYPDDHWEEPTSVIVGWPELHKWREKTRLPEESRALSGLSMSDFKGDLLTVGSGIDEDMPPQVLESYRQVGARYHSYQEHIIPGASHSLKDNAHQKEFIAVAGEWFTRHYPK